MKKIVFILVLTLFSIPSYGEEDVNDALSTEYKKSYALGVMIGRSLNKQFSGLDLTALFEGLKNSYNKEKLFISDAEVDRYFNRLNEDARLQKEQEKKAQLEKNKKEGEAFLDKNKRKPGVKVMENGIQYLVLKKGGGAKPTTQSRVKVHYSGTLLDGTKFDSSYDRGDPAEFNVNQLIKGWTYILPHMSEGARWKIFIPSDLAYGDRGTGSSIPGGATLVFELELIEVLSFPAGGN